MERSTHREFAFELCLVSQLCQHPVIGLVQCLEERTAAIALAYCLNGVCRDLRVLLRVLQHLKGDQEAAGGRRTQAR